MIKNEKRITIMTSLKQIIKPIMEEDLK